MPLSHLTLTVSHLPTSTSFFLSCLHPLGYRFVGHHENSVGFSAEPGQPADFWISEERPGVPPGAAHVAFPAPSQDAVDAFFIAALKAGGKMHGEPCLRDADQQYFSAAVIDFDGNSVEAVHRPGSSRTKPRKHDTALTVIENESVKSSRSAGREKARGSEVGSMAKGAPSTVSYKSAKALEPQSKTVVSPQSTSSSQQIQVSTKEESTKSAKAVAGTLLGAAAGAAIAYAMVKGESQSTTSTSGPSASRCIESTSTPPSATPAGGHSMPEYRAIEAAPREGMSEYARSTLSKNSKANSIFDGLEKCSRFLAPDVQTVWGAADDHHHHQFPEPRRNSTTGGFTYSAGSDMDIPIRAIEGIPADGSSDKYSDFSRAYPYNTGTLIDSYTDMPSRFGGRERDAGSVYTSSTLKPSSKRPSSSRRSQSSHRAGLAFPETGSTHSKRSGGGASAHSARNIPLPDSGPSSAVTSSSTHRRRRRRHSHSHSHSQGSENRGGSGISHSSRHQYLGGDGGGGCSTASSQKTIKSYRSARDVPLPESVADGSSTIFFDDVGGGVDVDSYFVPQAAAEEGGSRVSSKKSKSKSKTGMSAHSHRSKKSATTTSKLDEPVKPSDSVSQVSGSSSKRSGKSRR